MNIRRLIQVITAVLIPLFSYTAIAKLMDVEEFRRQLNNQEVPQWSKPVLVWLIPGSEIVVSLLLLIPATRIVGFYGSTFLMTLFTGYMALVVFRYFDRVSCGCDGVLRSMSFLTPFFIIQTVRFYGYLFYVLSIRILFRF